MTKINIFSGFLGAGKTTLIKKLISEAFSGEQIVIIENEFGQIGIDSGFLKESGVQISEMNSGCICCSLVGDFGVALEEVIEKFAPARIIIEPSGVGKLSDVIKAVVNLQSDKIELGSATTVIDATKCKIYLKNFSEFYENQIEHADTIILSRTANISQPKLDEAISLIRGINDKATVITTDWDMLTGKQIVDAMDGSNALAASLSELEAELHHHHHHEHDEHDEHCECGCHDHEHHHHDEECECHHDHEEHHEHHHHDHDEHCDCGCHDHEHHHEHDEHCDCGCHDHEHHHHHHADEVFESWGVETANKYNKDAIESLLDDLNDAGRFGTILRAKAILQSDDGKWIHFDFVPGEADVRYGTSDVIGKLCVIGAELNKDAIAEAFNIKIK